MNTQNPIAIYQVEDGQTKIEVRVNNETLWLSLSQIAELFGRDKSVISRHLKNIFETGELDKNSVVAKNATTATDGKTYQVEYFNLDVIISIGYRVNSKKGTQFRIWANTILKQYLLQGYALNEEKLKAEQEKLPDLKRALALSSRLIHHKDLSNNETRGILTILEHYSHALTVLDDYDHQRLAISGTQKPRKCRLAIKKPSLKSSYGDNRKGLGNCSVTKKTIPSKVRWLRFIKLLAVKNCIPASNKKRRICCILSSKTILSATATNVSRRLFLPGFYSGTSICTTKTAKSALPITPWSPLLC